MTNETSNGSTRRQTEHTTARQRFLRSLAEDLLGLLGLACIIAGAWQVYVPAAFIIVGAACLAMGARLARYTAGPDGSAGDAAAGAKSMQ